MTEIVHLYSTTDVAKVRAQLTKEQNGVDPITGLLIPDKQHVLDHDHQTQFVRAVLHRQTNAVLGKIENMWKRYLAWWYTGTLSQFLRGCADYLDKTHPQKYIHPSFIKHVSTQFNKLNEKQKASVLEKMESPIGANGKQRKLLFTKAVKAKKHTMQEILDIIEKEIRSE